MGFCPAGDIKNRLDVKWRSEGICEFFHWDSPDSKTQGEAFRKMLSGDRLILKKTHEFGKTMMLYGFGEVIKRIQTTDDPDDIIYQMRWNPQKQELIVPLMACTRTVNIKRIETVEAAMGKDHAFWDWLEHPYP